MYFYKNLPYPFLVLVYNNIYSIIIYILGAIDTGLELGLIWYTILPILYTRTVNAYSSVSSVSIPSGIIHN